MTTEEKRMRLTTFCAARSGCAGCPLNKGFKCGHGENFLKKWNNGNYTMADATVEKAYNKAFEKKTPAPPKAYTRKCASEYHNCPYSSALECTSPDSQCATCGWNPEENEKRRKRLETLYLTPKNALGLRRLRLKRKEV